MVLWNVIKSPIIKKVCPDFGTDFFFSGKLTKGRFIGFCVLLRVGQIWSFLLHSKNQIARE